MKLFALKHIRVGPDSFYPGHPNGDEVDIEDAKEAQALIDTGWATRSQADRVEVETDDAGEAKPQPTRIHASVKAPAKKSGKR